MSKSEVLRQLATLSYVPTDAFVKFVSRTDHARKRVEKWTEARGAWTGAAGWGILAHHAIRGSALTDEEIGDHLDAVETGIHHAENRVRHSMNGATSKRNSPPSRIQRPAALAGSTM